MPQIEFVPFEAIKEDDLLALVTDKVVESRTLEFKQTVVGSSDSDKREFLKDTTAFANTDGGLLIYGVAEADGVASGLSPFPLTSVDAEKLRLQSLLLSSVEPRLSTVQIECIPSTAGGYFILVRVPQSWRPPHRVTHGNNNRFWLRHSNGAFEPDTERLREVFNSSLESERLLEAFRDDRLARLNSGERGLPLSEPGILLVQVVGLERGRPDYVLPSPEEVNLKLQPPISSGTTHRYNFDGLLLHEPVNKNNATRSYTQIFRDWKIEMGRGEIIDLARDKPHFRASLVVAGILEAVERSIANLQQNGCGGPFGVLVVLSGLAGSVIGLNQDYISSDGIDRDTLRFPALILDRAKSRAELQRQLLPVWDAIWQAYDYRHCPYLRDEAGDWRDFPAKWFR